MSDIIVNSGDVPIAVRDHGGTGPPVLLLHGAGGHLLQWRDFPGRLTNAHRVVSFDLRGHGHSGDGPWSAAAVLDDIRAVINHFGLRDPAVVGNSLGGILAVMWARHHPESPAVSIDGHRSAATHPHNYEGLPEDQLRDDLAALTEIFDAQAAAMGAAIPAEQLRAMRDQALDTDDPDAEARFERGFTARDGHTFTRPDGDTAQRLRVMDEFVDVVPVVKQLKGLLLMLLSTRDMPMMPPRFAPLMAAHRAGLRRDLADVPPNVVVSDMDASHDTISQGGAPIADRVLEFLDRTG